MFRPLIDYYAQAEDDAVSSATLEDMVLLSALRTSLEGEGPATELDFVPNLVERWLASPRNGNNGVEAEGLQLLLCGLLDKLALNGLTSLNRSEIDTLIATHELIQRAGILDEYDGLDRLLAPHAEALAIRATKLGPEPRLSQLAGQIHFTSSEKLEAVPLRDISNFAGLDLPARGPVFTHHGNVKVLDFVPDRCMLVVDGGSCAVNGYVLGRIACSDNCHVRGNIGGVVVTNRGNIRAHKILDRAYVVAKYGSVRASHASDPELVYAGETITIDEATRLGTFASPAIQVGGRIECGNFTVSKSLQAEHYSSSERRDLVIELATNVSCDIYGGLVDVEAAQTLTRLARLRQSFTSQSSILELAHRECEHFANTAILYFLGNEERDHQIEELHRKRRRLGFLERVIVGIELLARSSERRLAIRESKSQIHDSAKDSDDEEAGLLETLGDVGEDEPGELPIDEDLAKEKHELEAISKKIQSPGAVTPSILLGLRERRIGWIRERAFLQDEIARVEAELLDMSDSAKALTRGTENLTRIQLLRRLLSFANERPRTDRFRMRAASPFVQLMLKTIKTRRQRSRSYETELEELKESYARQTAELMNAYRIPAPPLDEKATASAEVTGTFDAGVTVCTERYLLREAEVPNHSVIVTGDTTSARTYRREENVIIEIECTAPAL